MVSSNLEQIGSSIQKTTSDVDGSTLSVLINIVLFGAVIIFVAVYVINFIRAYNGKDSLDFKFKFFNKFNGTDSKEKQIEQEDKLICNYCGESNEEDAKFCKNCGNRLQ